MIRNETEYKEAVDRIKKEHARLEKQRNKLHETGLSSKEIKRVTDPMVSFHLQLKEEVESYERLRRGDFGELHNFHGIGQLLIGLRIAHGLSQRELAERLSVHESQVSRDERNEYFNITVERASRILDALNVDLRTTVEDAGLQTAA
jgi:DNA-binding transcriptional regulator YiaG